MPIHDFTEIYERYPDLIAQMPPVFTSHSFFLKLAQRNQALYIEALHSYRHRYYQGTEAPFMMVHGILARRLQSYPRQLEFLGDVESTDIFGESNQCAKWRKIEASHTH